MAQSDGSLNRPADEPCTVILANQPRLLRKMLQRAIAATPGLRVVGEVTDPGQIAGLVAQLGADWVILSLSANGDLPGEAGHLLDRYPRLHILAVSRDGSRARLMASGADVEEIHDLSLDGLLAVLSTRGRGEASRAE